MSCATQHVATDYQSAFKETKIPPGKALVYVLRPTSFGYAVYQHVFCENQYFGTLGIKSYLFRVFDPGDYTFTAQQQGVRPASSAEFTFEPDKVYYLRVVPEFGFNTILKLILLPDEKGRAYLRKSKLSSSPPFITLSLKGGKKPVSGMFLDYDQSNLVMITSNYTVSITASLIKNIRANHKSLQPFVYKHGLVYKGFKEDLKGYKSSDSIPDLIDYSDLFSLYSEVYEKYEGSDSKYYNSGKLYIPYFNPNTTIVPVNTPSDVKTLEELLIR